jgi:hypothetical protein
LDKVLNVFSAARSQDQPLALSIDEVHKRVRVMKLARIRDVVRVLAAKGYLDNILDSKTGETLYRFSLPDRD